MDLETENHLAALLMEEAQRLRKEADREGVHVYLHQPKARGRPNSRFLTATVLGVQQANRAVEINEMWRAREKEIELDNRLTSLPKDNARERGERHRDDSLREHCVSTEKKKSRSSTYMRSSRKHSCDGSSSIEDDGLGDEEVDKFLHSRAKRGRGAVGSRMDEPGPYPKCLPNIVEDNAPATSDSRVKEDWELRVLGPERPSLKLHENECESAHYQKKIKSRSSKKQHSNQKHQSSEGKHGTKRRKSKCSKHHNRSE